LRLIIRSMGWDRYSLAVGTINCYHSRKKQSCGDEEALQMAGSWDDSRAADEIVSRLRQERTTRCAQERF